MLRALRMVVLCLVVAGCSSAISPAPTASPLPTAAVTAAPTPTQVPSTLEEQLLSPVPPAGFSCVEVDSSGPIRHITCTSVAGDAPNLTVNTYADQPALYNIFNEHVAFRPTGSEEATTCTSGPFLGAFTVGGHAIGEVLCDPVDPANPTMEWTVDSLNLFVVASPPAGWDAARLFDWWQSIRTANGAGAVAVAPLVPASTPEVTPTERPLSYAKLTARQWALVVKAPDNYVGNGYVIWACITQFDAATGPDAFRAQGSYTKLAYWYVDGTNVYISGDSTTLGPFVAKDVVAMNVVDLGSYTYTTTQGGSITVPQFMVATITRKGSC